MIPILLLGFLLGLRHAIDVDHVVAVTTIVTRERSFARAGLIGIAWGIGHTVTILVVGIAIIAFDVVFSPHVALIMEALVALMLIVLGVINLVGALRRQNHHEHPHPSAAPASPRPRGVLPLVRPLIVGIVHGLGGSAALTLLVLATVHDALPAVVYLVLFGVGTIAGMMLITTALALSFRFATERFARLDRYLGYVTGSGSVAFGAFLAYRVVVDDGLFASS
jgi:high-affinity nickel permease